MFNIKGVDISNNNSIDDLSTLSTNGVEYVYLKATEGTTFRDNTSIVRCAEAKELGLKVGFYHFLVGTSAPESQMENAYFYLKDNKLLDKCDLKFSLDIESNFSNLTDYVVRAINKWRELTDMELCIYTYSSFIEYLMPISDTIKNIPLWIANYTSRYDKVPETFFRTVCGWQYSEAGSIGLFSGDCDMFNEECLLDSGEWKNNNRGLWYEYKDGSYPVSQWKKIKNEWYYFDERGYAYQNRWLKSSDKWYYFKDSCKMARSETLSYSFNKSGEYIE